MQSDLKRNFGFIPSRKDPRDYVYAQRVAVDAATLPSSFYSKRLPFIRDQKQFGTCGGHAGAEGVDYHFSGINASPLYAYTAAKVIEGNLDEGVQPVSIAQVMVKRGICREDLCSYDQLVNVQQLPSLTPDMDNDAATRKGSEYAKVQTVDEVKHSIANGNATLLAILVFSDFETAVGGFIPLPDGNMLGGHLVYADGYDDELTHTYPDGHVEKGFVRCINSWGSGWGDKGYFYLPYSFFTWHLQDFPVHCFIEGWSVIMPNPVQPVSLDTIKVTLGSQQAVVNGQPVDMGTVPVMNNDHVLVPLRFISEELGATVTWDAPTQTVTIRKEKI